MHVIYTMIQLQELLNRDDSILHLYDKHLTLEDIILICSHICSSQTLHKIILGYNNIGAEGMSGKPDFKKINNRITEGDGAKHIAEAISNSQTLHKITFRYNNIGVEGMSGKA